MTLSDLSKIIIEAAIPVITDLFSEHKCSDSDNANNDVSSLVADCCLSLMKLEKLNIEDINEIMNCFSKIDSCILKLDALSINTCNESLEEKLSVIQDVREKTYDEICRLYEEKSEELLKAESNLGTDENELYLKYDKEWNCYQEKYQKLIEYNLKSLEKSADAMFEFVDD